MAFSAASHVVLLLFLLLLLLFQPSVSLSSRTTPLMKNTVSKSETFVFPLRTRKIPTSPFLDRKLASLSSMKQPSKLLFHHNISLTVSLSVGTPPQNVSIVLDTGSELSWLLCSNTTATTPSFRPHSSSSYSPIPCSSPVCRSDTRDLPVPGSCDSSSLCHVSLSYADASSSEGTLAADEFRLGGDSPSIHIAFGCMSSVFSSSGEDPVADGLLGMNRGALSFVTQTRTRRFSYCISDRDSAGVLLIGPTNPPLPAQMNYTPLVQVSLPLPYYDRVAYSVQLEGIRVGSKLLPIPKSVLVPDHTGAGQTMVDSGSQFTFLLGPAYAALKAEFMNQTRRLLAALDEPDFVFQGAFDLCFKIRDGAPIPRLPAVILMFRGAEVSVSGERLLYRVEGEKRGADGVWCFTFGNSDLVPMAAYVIGHHHQQNVWVEYDLENGRVGFAPVRCDLASRKLGVVL